MEQVTFAACGVRGEEARAAGAVSERMEALIP